MTKKARRPPEYDRRGPFRVLVTSNGTTVSRDVDLTSDLSLMVTVG